MRIDARPLELAPQSAPDAARVEHAARQLEGQFAQMLVKSMRDASFGDSLFPNENQVFRDMYDQQLAQALTSGKGLGLAPMIARQLARQSGIDAGGGKALDTRIDARPGPTRAAAAAQAYASAAGTIDVLSPGADRALDLIAGREGGDAGEGSPLDALVRRLMAGPEGAAATTGMVPPGAAARVAAEFAPRSPEHFVASIWDQAQAAARELGVDARALVAQAALETGWGRRQIQRDGGGSANNLFGIKANGWSGERATTRTHEYAGGVRRTETAQFRAYASPAESFADYVRLLKNNPRYQKALQAGGDVRRFAQALQNAGYATDPGYAAKITAIANGPTVNRAMQAIAGVAARAAGGALAAADVAGFTRR